MSVEYRIEDDVATARGRLLSPARRVLFGQIVRYAITGGLASVVNIGIYHLLVTRSGWDVNVAWVAGFAGAVVTGYVINSRWSFRDHGSNERSAATTLRYAVVSLVSLALNSLWVWLLVKHFRLPEWAPYPLVLGVTPLAVFTLNRRWVFG